MVTSAIAGSFYDMKTARVQPITTRDLREDDPTRGFRSFGEFAQAVRRGSNAAAIPDERLLIGAAAPGTVGTEGIGQDGGFAVPPQWSDQIDTRALTEDALLRFTDLTPIEGNSMVFPKDETVPWGTDGPRAYWQNEGPAGTLTKPKLGEATLRCSKLLALVPVSDELLADASALGAYLPPRLGDAIRWKTNEAILLGNGNGQPQGALTSGAAITIAKESGQANQTFDVLNFRKMLARLPPGSLRNSIWLIAPDAVPTAFGVNFGSYPIYPPDADLEEQAGAVGVVLGRPMFESQHCAAFSSQGDLMLLDLSYYRAIQKSLDPTIMTSLHLYFDANVTAFRVTFRVDGQSKIVQPMAQAKGSSTLSPFIQLAAR
jgi:HK97 family phage major capsid protein